MGKKALTVTGITADKVYDGSTVATFDTTHMQPSGLVGNDTVTLDGTPVGSFAGKNVGTYTINVTGLTIVPNSPSTNNYTLTQPADLTAKISPATLTVTMTGSPTKVYDGTTNATLTSANYSLSGLIGAEKITVTHAAGTYDSKDVHTATTVTSTPLGTGDFTPVSGSGALLSNYALPTTAIIWSGSITPATLTATIVGDPTKVYDGTTNAKLTSANYSLSGLIGAEKITVTHAAGTYNSRHVLTAATVTSTPLGSEDFTPVSGSGALLSNYTLPTTAIGPGTITPAR